MPVTSESIPGARNLSGEFCGSRRSFTLQMPILFLATFASEDLACISAGVLVAQGRLTYLMGFTACFLGIFAGDLLAFVAGRLSGRNALGSKWLSRWIAPQKISSARQWLEKRGTAAVFISRFTPGLRVATYFSAGLLRMQWWKFVLSLVAAITVWVLLIISATNLLGDKLLQHFLNSLGSAILAIALSFVLLVLLRRFLPKRRMQSFRE
jgi:membrane protein DedA with SNARE-associated domain